MSFPRCFHVCELVAGKYSALLIIHQGRAITLTWPPATTYNNNHNWLTGRLINFYESHKQNLLNKRCAYSWRKKFSFSIVKRFLFISLWWRHTKSKDFLAPTSLFLSSIKQQWKMYLNDAIRTNHSCFSIELYLNPSKGFLRFAFLFIYKFFVQ